MNNAGTWAYKNSEDVTEEELSSVMSTNFEASFHFSQLAHPLMKASGNGSIVFMSSVAGSMSLPLSTAYAASKGNPQFYSLELSFNGFKTLLHPYKKCFVLPSNRHGISQPTTLEVERYCGHTVLRIIGSESHIG